MFSKAEPDLTLKLRAKLFMAAHWRGVILLYTPVALLFLVLPHPAYKWQWCAYCLLLMAVFWVCECVPLAITGLFPISIFPLVGVMTTTQTCKCYMNDSLMMFIGSVMLAFSVEQSGLHKRLAYMVLRTVGFSHRKLLLAMCSVTMFISMWITNTAATTMMIPINFAVLRVLENQGLMKIYEKNEHGELEATDLTTCYFCAATYSATIGGIGTLVGTATNLVFKGLFQNAFPAAPDYLSFPRFSAFGVPYMLMLETALYFCLCIQYFGMFRPDSKRAKDSVITPSAKEAVKKVIVTELKKLGSLSYWEVMVLILFGGAMFFFFGRSPQMTKGWGDILAKKFDRPSSFIKDSALCMLVLFIMCLLPSTLAIRKNCTAKHHEELPKGQIPSVLIWKSLNAQMPYNFAFLLGGGFALSTAAGLTGLNYKMGMALQGLKSLPPAVTLLMIIMVVTFVTNFVSNVAVCNVFVPLAMQLAQKINRNPLWYNIAAGFCSSFCFMMPVGTPGNLIVQVAANIPTRKMVIAGTWPTLAATCVSFIMILTYAPKIWPDLKRVPVWARLG